MITRENLNFGEGHFVGSVAADPSFWDLPVREQARVVGWANSCPVVEELTDHDNTQPGRGPEAMLRRYAETDLWFSIIGQEVQNLNPKLYGLLMSEVTRKPGEPAGKYEPESVPEWHEEFMSPMGTLAGYALPRIFVEQIGTKKEGVEPAEVQARVARGMDVLEAAIPQAETPLDLLALVAEGIIQTGDTNSDRVLYHVLSKGWLGEHNARTMLDDFKRALSEKAPKLWRVYTDLSEEEKLQNGIA